METLIIVTYIGYSSGYSNILYIKQSKYSLTRKFHIYLANQVITGANQYILIINYKKYYKDETIGPDGLTTTYHSAETDSDGNLTATVTISAVNAANTVTSYLLTKKALFTSATTTSEVFAVSDDFVPFRKITLQNSNVSEIISVIDSNNEEYYKYILSYSPYDNVEKKNYTNLLVTTGLHDSQVQYWEPAKWVARLRATNGRS